MTEQLRFFAFIRECATLLGIQNTPEESDLLADESWFFCFDDGLTPEQAVAEYHKALAGGSAEPRSDE